MYEPTNVSACIHRLLVDRSVAKDFSLDFSVRYNLFYFYGGIICIFNAIKNS